MAGSFYGALSGLLAPPLDAAERQARMAELARSKTFVEPPIDAVCRKRLADTSVAVVGGGLAGLAAARSLARGGAIVTLFEAGAEVGGRVRSDASFSKGHVIELGAELVGAIHPTWLALAREYRLGLIGRTDAAQHAKTGLEARMILDKALTLGEQTALAEEMTKRVLRPIGILAKLIKDPARPWLQPGLKKFDSLSVADLLARSLKIRRGSRLWLAMELLLVNNNVAPLDELNLLGLLCLVKGGQFGDKDKALMGYWTELEVFRSSEGCQSLALAMAHEFETRLQGRLRRRRPVVAIDLAQRPVITSNGFDSGDRPLGLQVESYDYVVFAVPPSVWSRVKITPVHPMDPTQVGVMNTGPAVKFFSELNRRVWIDSAGAPLGGASALGQIWESTDEQTRLAGQNLVLAVFAGGRLPTSYEPTLESLYPGYHEAVVNKRLMDWPNERHVCAGYTSPKKGQIFSVGAALNRPFRQRLVFAGEHTSMAYFGYMEGALQSGLSAAQQVLKLACSAPAPANPPTQVRTAAMEDEVIGRDDRVRVNDTLTVPARWICAMDLLVDDPLHGHGAPQIESLSRATGILIGPSHVLTAAHVFDGALVEVDGRTRKVPVARIRVSPARNGDNGKHALGAAYSKALHRPLRFTAENDYALIVLDRDLSQATHKSMNGRLGYWGQSPQVAALRALDPASVADAKVSVIGYPGDRCGNDVIKGDDAAQRERRIRYCAQRRHDEWASTAWQSNGIAHARAATGLMLHDADTYEGESGAPIFLLRGDTLDLLGVHGGVMTPADGGEPTNNRGARVTPQMLAELRDWINGDAGRPWAEVRNNALVFLPNSAAHESEQASDPESIPEAEGESAADVSRRLAKIAAKIDEGLRAGKSALPQVQPRGRRELLAFAVSLLRTHFFPTGYGIVDASGKVVRASARAIVDMQVEKTDGSRWPFEHRVRLSISAKSPDSARWAGEHHGDFFSVITLFAGAFDGASAGTAAAAAVHEIVHMLFSMLGRLREQFGEAVANRFLTTDPWRQLDMRPFSAQSDVLAAALDDLLKLLRLPATAAEFARSLVAEAFAYTMGREFAGAIEAAASARRSGPKIVIDAVSVADLLVHAYVLERTSVPATVLAAPAVAEAVKRLAPAIEALTDAMRPKFPRQRISELIAASPFTQGAGESEPWTGGLPARVTRRIFNVPERARSTAHAACGLFLSANSSSDYEMYIAASTTGRMTPFINGRYWGGAKSREDQFDAFNAMQEAVEGLKSGDSLFLAAWMFDPSLPLTKTSALGVNALGNRNWGELFQRKARDGAKIRIVMTDFSFVFKDQNDKLYHSFLPTLDTLIAGLAPASRDNLKYVVSLHPATHLRVHVGTHHQKFMVLKTAEMTTAFCGGLDIAFMRTPAYWGKLDATTYRWLWHDIHSKLEGLITKDLEREFVMRWNREKGRSMVASRPGWKPFETLVQSSPTETDRAAFRNGQELQMLRTVSIQGAGRNIQDTRRDDIWQGYLRLVGCANRFLYMENQYFREPRMADAIVTQAKAQPELVVIIVVPSETDDLPDAGKKHGDSRQHEFFVRLTNGIPASRLRVYTMFHRIIHSKFIMADDRALCVGSANANPRGFFLDSELNVMLDDPQAVQAFRHRLWAHNLGVAEAIVAGWKAPAFTARWDAVATANASRRSSPEKMIGEAIIPFNALKDRGERQPLIDDVETEWGATGALHLERMSAAEEKNAPLRVQSFE